MDIETVLSSAENEEVFLAESAWFTDPAPEELDDAYAEFEERFEAILPAFVARLGEPDFTEESDPELRDEIYCEAMRLAGWRHNDGYRLLALGQHDQETPVFVSFGFRALQA